MSELAERLARPEILALPPLDIAAAAQGYGANAIKLDANESPHPPLLNDAVASSVNRYPEPQPKQLLDTLAALYGVDAGNIVATRGADDAIDVLIRTFCRPGIDAIAILQPTFSAYAQFARLQGARVIEASLGEGFGFDHAALLKAIEGEANLKLIFLCSPNNPTGNLIPAAEVRVLCELFCDTLIVLDEAYIEFADAASLAAEACTRDNLIVLRTLSKAYGLAGARVGALIASPPIAALARKALPPYPLPSLSIAAALQSLNPSRRFVHEDRIEEAKSERRRVADALRTSPVVRQVHESEANFLFLEVDEPQGLETKLRRLGIRVRFRPNAAPGGLRLSIGTPHENDAALAGLGATVTTSERRRATVTRDTNETKIAVSVDLDCASPRRIATGCGFFDHMLDQVASHGGFALTVACEGDHVIDAHHSIEDSAIALGRCLSDALGDRRGIGRFGFTLPMDEAQAEVLIDLSGRSFSRFEGTFKGTHIGTFPTEMTPHVFRSIADGLGAAIHVRVSGENDHHKVESCFKAFGQALRQAVARDGGPIPSTKGTL